VRISGTAQLASGRRAVNHPSPFRGDAQNGTHRNVLERIEGEHAADDSEGGEGEIEAGVGEGSHRLSSPRKASAERKRQKIPTENRMTGPAWPAGVRTAKSLAL
jgi:hypothetical protein